MTRYLTLSAVMAMAALVSASRVDLSAQSTPALIISEVQPAGSGSSYGADWFEVTNTGTVPVNITGWKVDDSSNGFATAVPLRGVTSIPPGRSAVFFEGTASGSTDAAIIAAFSTAWFGSPTPPGGLLIGAYGGAGVGLSGSGDAVNLFDATGTSIAGVTFSASTANRTFDNAAGLASVSTLSTAGVNGAFLAFGGTETGSPGRRAGPASLTTVDLSTYLRIGRFDLPEPTRTSAPPNSVLAQEVSAVTYNWDTNTLFVTGDGGTSIVQVSKIGELIDSMTLAPGASPQGTDFYDPEGLTYVGGGRFVMVEERDRQAVLFTYAPGTTLTRADTQTVKLGTFAPNIGIEGMTYDPQTGGFIAVKETAPQGIFQTGIDFAAGTATNGSATTENSFDLFDPALAGLLDFADVFALSNLPSLSGPQTTHLLVLSQESGRIVNIDRNGNISSALTIANDPGNPLSVPAQQHEGLTMDGDGYLYVVSENGGGDFDHPQLWVYAPSSVPNQAPTALALTNQQNTIAENASTAVRIKVADVVVTDDGLGTNNLTVSGPDAGVFEVDSNGLYLRAGTALDFETRASYSVTVQVDDPNAGGNPDASAGFSLAVTDVGETAALIISEVAPWGSGNSPYAADWFEVTNTTASAVSVAGWKVDDNSNSFGAAVALGGITSIAPGESVIFMETANPAAAKAALLSVWFGASPPAGLQVGSYSGAGVGLGTGGDAVNLYDAGGALAAAVSFGASPGSPPFATFDNAAGLNNAAITQLSAVGIHGAAVAAGDANEIGSPGTIANPPPPPAHLIVSEIAPWSSGNSPVGADWFEVTNVGASPADLTGWKVDDSSESPVAALPLTGITTIAPGESVVFIETANLAGARTTFLNTWFGANAPPGLQIGSYTGGGIGLSTGGDAVNLYDSAGVLKAHVPFGVSPTGPVFQTFDNTAGLNGVIVSQLSIAGVNGAFVAADGMEAGSPGTTAADTTAPVIDPHTDVTASTVDASGAIVTYAVPAAHDNADLTIAVSCAPASGALFPLGSTTVTCNAADAALNAAAPVTFTVHVVDTTPPVLAPLANIATVTGGSSEVVTFTATATDNVSPPASIAVSCLPPSGTAFPVGTTLVTCQAVDAAGNASAPVTFTITVTVSPLSRFVVLSRDLTWLRAGAAALTGDVGAIERRQAGHGGDADGEDGGRNDVTVRIGVGATMRQPSSRVVGDTVLLQTRSSVYDVIDNFLLARRTSTILGTETRPMAVPFLALPAFPAVQAGTQMVSVPKNKTATLAAGRYGAVQVAGGGTLVLSGGLYEVASIDLAASATVVFHAATELRVKGELSTKSKARLILDPSVAGLRASHVVIYVAGRDEDCHHVEADEDGDEAGPVTVHIGAQNVVQANIYAARGTVWLKSKTRATGAFIGMHVRIGVSAELTLDSAFR